MNRVHTTRTARPIIMYNVLVEHQVSLKKVEISPLEKLDILYCHIFFSHTPKSECMPLLENKHMKVNCCIYNIGTPAFSVNSQNVIFLL